ncbi:Hypothetical predicted protein [Cloeon dipterum]|uniref:Phosphoribulokinase/uridine kinase domain-containing protein n=1 Tax=Cloeon dipterum TaxID=197152 RepID=A0A8S1CQ13_9INSE|nr:Hypothetical predicted protein [Cloeon dipterum]
MSRKLHSLLPGSRYLGLDRYFRDLTDPEHQQVLGLDHINFDIPSALNWEAWRSSIQHILNGTEDTYTPCLSCPDDEKLPAKVLTVHPSVQVPETNMKVLILDGFLVLNDEWTSRLCDLKFYFTLTKEQCLLRRDLRNYDPPDVPGYFEECVWPEHERMKALSIQLNPDMVLVDGNRDCVENLDIMLTILKAKC